jgi:diguanylate cyclase (GGDEF)-like protein
MPLGTAGHLDGFLAVIGPPVAARQFEDADLDFLRALGDRAAGALHNARLYAETTSAASLDGLTGLLNHATFKRSLDDLLRESLRTGQALSLAMLDADHFKRCNDTHGHPFGDRVLVALAQTIRTFVRPTDLVGRWGGEEFAIALPGADADAAYGVCERIRGAVGMLQLPSRDGTNVQAPTISLGIATFPGTMQTAGELVEAADAALYQAKAQGRNRTCLSS